jgi:hypothetical protein
MYAAPSEKRPKEETLDPVGWPEFRQCAHYVIDDAISYARGITQLRMAARSWLCKSVEESSERKRVR